MVENIFYEKLKDLMPVLEEEIDEIKKAIRDYEYFKQDYTSKKYLEDLFNEIQDASIVLLSMFNTVRLKLRNIIEGEI